VRQDSSINDHPAIDQLLRIHIEKATVEAKVFVQPFHVNATNCQPDSSFRFDHAQKFQRLGCLTDAEMTYTQLFGMLRFHGQSIARKEFVHEDLPLGLFGGLIAEFWKLKRGVSVDGPHA
jgi:hypothetical protein